MTFFSANSRRRWCTAYDGGVNMEQQVWEKLLQIANKSAQAWPNLSFDRVFQVQKMVALVPNQTNQVPNWTKLIFSEFSDISKQNFRHHQVPTPSNCFNSLWKKIFPFNLKIPDNTCLDSLRYVPKRAVEARQTFLSLESLLHRKHLARKQASCYRTKRAAKDTSMREGRFKANDRRYRMLECFHCGYSIGAVKLNHRIH